MFKEYQGKQIIRKAFEITSPRQIHIEHDMINDKRRYALLTSDGPVEFVAHEEVKVGDFVVYLNDKDVYHCNRKVFLERNEYPSLEDVQNEIPEFRSDIEAMMKELKCEGEFISASFITDNIDSVDFKTVNLAGQKMMFCGIRMKGGFVVTGEPSVCISPENWRDEIGKKISFENAFNEIYRLEAYLKVEGKR
jgi:predicted ester cyclase